MVYTIGKHSSSVEINKDVGKGCVWKELLFAFIASVPFFTQGIETDALTSSAHAGNIGSAAPGPQVPGTQVPLGTTLHVLAAAAAAPVLCCVIERFGRKVGIFIVSLVQGISCIPLLLDVSEINVIALHILAGISSGGLYTIFPIYIREISSIQNRALALSLFIPMTGVGYLMRLVTDLDTLMFLVVALVVVQMVAMFCLVESPSYLVMKGSHERAKLIISKLKCLPPEHEAVLQEFNGLKDESDRAKASGKLHTITIFKNPIWRDATKIGLVLHGVMMLSGSIIFLDQQKTLVQLDSPMDPDRVLTLACFCAGSLICAAVIRFMERSYLLTCGFFVIAVSMGILAVYTQADLTVYTLRWVPVAALGVLIGAYGVVWGLPVVVITELFNCEIRSHQLALLYVYSQLIKLVHLYTFPHIEEYIGVYTVFYMFVGINLFGAVYCLFHIPQLKNKTTRQIERQLKRVPLLKM
ncbi:solute carrier family 2, facilitated glucose transporter member 2-like [Leguminivora glycinivorella]|uniref:solute carrier family 2, facilitated glucose transporter member 2-like n=1 Tax=Leguminivora glycinivorella TaxID=1035111 RepID=UPI00200DB1CD|nr:solute carrier family 2, facilitated glucose transporter member 2-like [Leguminivora glycinivorella]